jgi:hypothetical protein
MNNVDELANLVRAELDVMSKPVDTTPWVPCVEAGVIKVLGKCMEEYAEAISSMARVLIQGIDGVHPVTGKPNREWIVEELGDVQACTGYLVARLKLDAAQIEARRLAKVAYLRDWMMLDRTS